jgi:hypothetical protein
VSARSFVCALAVIAIAACSDAPSGSAPLAPVSHPVTKVSRLRGTIDAVAGTMTFDAASADAGMALTSSAPSAAIYGDQGVTVRIYNSPVVTSAPVAGKKTYTANVGIRNLLAWQIGDEQGGSAPADTLGIYVFLNTNPVVSGTSSPCGACTVTARNRRGTMSFTAPNQGYWYWPELLGAAGSGTDTTRVRQTWVFEADTAVTRFNFDVLVSTAWAAPNESVWRVEYPGDSLPDTQSEPRWTKFATNGGPTASIAGGLMLTLKKTRDSLVYVRRDSLRSTSDGMIEARLRLDDGGNSASPQPGIAFDDNTRYVGLFVSDSSSSGRARVGFVNATGDGFVASDTVGGVGAFRVYQLRKFGADSAVIYVDGTRRVKAGYASLPVTKAAAPLPSYAEFGFTAGTVRTTTSTWSYVVYKIGEATP